MPKIISVIILLLLSAQMSWAVKMATAVKEALYLFEMKGDFSKAIKILEDIINNGDPDDKNNAYFYLAKIQDLSGNASIASLYYKQSLITAQNPAEAYWISEQLARLSPDPENLIKQKIPLSGNIFKGFDTPSHQFLLLENRELYQTSQEQTIKIPFNVPTTSSIHSISFNGVWYSEKEPSQLFFQPLSAKKPIKSIPISNEVNDLFPLPGNQALVLSGNTLFLYSNDGIRFSIKDRYQNCSIIGLYEPLNRFLLNCPDNAIHFIQTETGIEDFVISQLDPITHIKIESNVILIASGHAVWLYKPDEKTPLIWKHSNVNIEDLAIFENKIALLETSGKVLFIDKQTGFPISSLQSDASWIFPMATGSLGLFSKEGRVTAVDTLLKPLWSFHLGINLQNRPFKNSDLLYLPLANQSIVALNSLYYGKTPLLSNVLASKAQKLASKKQWKELSPLLDSLLKVEYGNAEAWFLKAILAETANASERDQQKAWSEAVRLSLGDSQKSKLILSRYSQMIEAKFTHFLQLSPKTSYPQFFGNKNNLYTVDVPAQTLQNINPETGELRWIKKLGKLANSPVMANDENTLAIASGFKVHIHELLKEGYIKTLELPGKPFHIEYSGNAIYISTWNGFLIKILKPNLNLAWSRKIFTMPFHFTSKGSDLLVASLEGEILNLWNSSGQIKKSIDNLQSTITHLESKDSLLVIANADNKIFLFSTKSNTLLASFSTSSEINSLQFVEIDQKNHILAGLANQQIVFYNLETDISKWDYNGSGSIFVTPVIHNNIAWIDQKNEIIGLSLTTGKVIHRYKTPGGASTPFILDKTIFTASPKRLLYAFNLPF